MNQHPVQGFKRRYQRWQRHRFFRSPRNSTVFAAVMRALARPIYAWAYELIAADLAAADEIADIGCGNAIFARHMRERGMAGKRLTLVDQSPSQLRAGAANVAIVAEANVVRTLAAAAERLPLRDDAFDLVVSTGSINLWTPPQQGLAECVRILKPGGVLWIFDQRPCTTPALAWDALVVKRVFGLGLPGYEPEPILTWAETLPLQASRRVYNMSLYGLRWEKR